MTLTLAPVHWYSWDFDVMDDARPLARVEMSSWGEKGVVTIDGTDHRLYREGVGSGDFILERAGHRLAKATKPSAFRSRFELSYDGWHYTVRKPSVWRREFIVERGDTQIGSLVRSGWGRAATVTLPEAWPLAVKVFVMWLAMILWKRESNAS